MATSDHPSGVPARRRRPCREPVRAYQAMNTVRALEHLALRPLSGPELATALQIHQRTARRLLRRLHAEAYTTLRSGPRRRYHLTRRLAVLGRQAIARDDLPRVAAPWVATLATHTAHVATPWIPCYTDVVCVLRADPDGPLPQAILGDLEPAHATAPGKALLAHRDAWRDSIFAQPLRRHTPRTLTDPRDLAAELARIRQRGHATDHGEHHEDVHAIAAPVCQDDAAIAALAVSLTAKESTAADLDALAATVVHYAAALDAAINIGLSWTPAPNPTC
jgi:IclR family transcriptional regulator, acetate operon repressor